MAKIYASFLLVALAALAAMGCERASEERALMCEAEVPEAPAAADVWSLRRLTRTELAQTFDALLGLVPESVRRLPAEDSEARAAAPAASGFEVDLYRQIANEAAQRAAPRLIEQWSCGRDRVCLRAQAAKLVERAYREPLARDERAAYLSVFAGDNDARAALSGMLELVFQSPRFLYVLERGVPRSDDEQTRELTPWELATRLSYFFWSEPPDDALREAAERGRLHETLRAHAERLARDPKAARTLGVALQKWAAPDLEVVAKAGSVYPEFDPEVRASMIAQFERFAAMVIENDSSFGDILTAQRAPVDARLARLLGMRSAPEEGFRVMDLPQPQFGLFTLPGVLTSNARADDSSPVQRGLFIRQKVLCQIIPPPPPGVATLPAAGASGASFRERFEEHTRNAACAGCHSLMDPLGFPFEIYDGLGRLREGSGEAPVAGVIEGIATPAQFDDLRGLVDAIIAAPEASRCWAEHWALRALGPDGGREAGLIDRLAGRVGERMSLAALWVEIATSDEFGQVRRPR